METYRLSSKLREQDREYLIQTTNDISEGSVMTSVYVDGRQTDTVRCPHPTEINPEEVLSLVKAAHGEKKKEIEVLLRAFKQIMEGANSEALYQLGTAFFYKKLYPEAIELFDAVVCVDRNAHQAHNHIGLTYIAMGRTDDAIAACTKAVEGRPGYADFRNNLGEAFLADGQADEAIKEFEQAVSINMYYADAYFNLGLAHTLKAANGGAVADKEAIVNRIVECLNRASMIEPALQERSGFENGIQTLKSYDFAQGLNLLKGVREQRREERRLEFATFYMRFVLYPGWVTEKAVEDRIVFLERELQRNPSYIDLQAELAQCYLEKSRLIWQKGVKQLEKTSEMNGALTWVTEALEDAGSIMPRLSETIRKMTEKG